MPQEKLDLLECRVSEGLLVERVYQEQKDQKEMLALRLVLLISAIWWLYCFTD